MAQANTLEEAKVFFLSNSEGHVECIRKDGGMKECYTYPEAVAFFREEGWYWVRSNPDANDNSWWSVMLWDGSCWLVSGIEWPCYTDSDLAEIKSERLMAPDEEQ